MQTTNTQKRKIHQIVNCDERVKLRLKNNFLFFVESKIFFSVFAHFNVKQLTIEKTKIPEQDYEWCVCVCVCGCGYTVYSFPFLFEHWTVRIIECWSLFVIRFHWSWIGRIPPPNHILRRQIFVRKINELKRKAFIYLLWWYWWLVCIYVSEQQQN